MVKIAAGSKKGKSARATPPELDGVPFPNISLMIFPFQALL